MVHNTLPRHDEFNQAVTNLDTTLGIFEDHHPDVAPYHIKEGDLQRPVDRFTNGHTAILCAPWSTLSVVINRQNGDEPVYDLFVRYVNVDLESLHFTRQNEDLFHFRIRGVAQLPDLLSMEEVAHLLFEENLREQAKLSEKVASTELVRSGFIDHDPSDSLARTRYSSERPEEAAQLRVDTMRIAQDMANAALALVPQY